MTEKIRAAFYAVAALVLSACAMTQARRDAVTAEICGPDGANDYDDRLGPACEHKGWDGRRYREEPE